ncbi:hypothetical protein [Streptomyces cinereospinus]|uniref:Uncharacterized protein n=1 Tax=Streptomyces cinereospinus TaxID=285561 RepID=A0ABV5N368_9ACTN
MEPVRESGGPPAFFRDGTGSFSYEAKTRTLTCQRVADPSPLVVSRDRPQQPLTLFDAVGRNFAPGRYEGWPTLERASGRGPLTSRFCLLVAEEAFAKTGQFVHRDFRDDVPAGRAPDGATADGCYRLSPV